MEVPSAEEKEALDALRSIKERVRALKTQLREKRGAGGDVSEGNADHEREMERLRGEWEAWEAKRAEAAKRRMILLGHEDPE